VTKYRERRPIAQPEPAPEAERPAVSPAPKPGRRPAYDAAVLYALVAFGSVIGGVLRAVASLMIHMHLGSGFPWGTLFVNITGSLAIGFYATLTGPEGRLFPGTRQRQFVMTGICGGYTTFSAFSLETFQLAQAGDLSAAGINVGLSLVSWLAAVWLGHVLATGLNRLKGA
jgi:fluoride exporter